MSELLKPCRALDPCLSNPGVWITCCGGRVVVCPWCSGYRPFALSNDEPERVYIEIEAAKIEARYLNAWICEDPSDWPWSDCPWTDDNGHQCRRCEAEDLARIMAEHEQRPR